VTQHLHWHGENKKLQSLLGLHIVKDVVVVLREAFHPCIHPSCHPSMDGIIQGRKPWQKNITSSLRMCRCLGKPCLAPGGGGGPTPKILISISATNPTYICWVTSSANIKNFSGQVLMDTCGMWYIERFWKCSL
jgi:hypothetical protein